jgi:hypothetical protein
VLLKINRSRIIFTLVSCTTGGTTFEELSSRIDTKLKQNLEDYRSELQPIKHAVQEHLSATVPASRMPEDKLRDLREAVHAAVVPVLDADDLEELLGPTPAQTDAGFDW